MLGSSQEKNMSVKAVIVRQGTYKRSVTVLLPDGLTAADLVAALNSKAADEVGDFIICRDTFSVPIESNKPEFPEDSWEVVSTDEKGFNRERGDFAAELKAGAIKDAETAARDASQFTLRHQIESLNATAFGLLEKGDVKASRKIVSAASVLYRLLVKHDCAEGLWLVNLKSFNCSASGQHRNAWRYGRQALQIAARLYGEDSAQYGVVLNNMAEGQIDAGSYSRAEKMLTKGMALLDKAIAAKVVDEQWALSAKADAEANYRRLPAVISDGEAA
jgi:hypothetical protein